MNEREGEDCDLQCCSVGKHTTSECHKKSYTQCVKLNNIEILTPSEIELLSLRSNVSSELLLNVCDHHKIYFLQKFVTYQHSCFDPFRNHRKKITKALRCITLDFSKKINTISDVTKSIPGQKICNTCREKVQKHREYGKDQSQASATDSDRDKNMYELEEQIQKEETLESVNASFVEIGESPLKLHAVASHSKATYMKRKVESVCHTVQSKISRVLENECPSEKPNWKQINEELQQKSSDMDTLLGLIRDKLQSRITRREKIQLLTLVPASWSRKKISEEFNVSEYSVRQSRDLLMEKGILAIPEPRKGKVLKEKIVELVTNFYQSDEYSRIMPGKKDYVSISKNHHMQKRLLLANLNELYSSFKFEYPNIKIGVSKFCMLRPKWCVFTGRPGTHIVCVCSIHQNVELLLHACQIEETYQDLITFLVCSTDNRDCMLRHCCQCPTPEKLRMFLLSKFEEYDGNDEISYSQWISTDRTELLHCTTTFDDYLNILIEKLEKLVPHSFITKEQSKFLKETKANLVPDTCIVLMDFGENYSYILQDEAQGYHWTNNACTLHSVVIYTRTTQSEDLQVSNCCSLSDDLEHDSAFVYETQKKITQYIKTNFPIVKKIYYFSDGCAAQYKNCKNFLNLCCHLQDFSLQALWVFFSTSHGKSPCDGISGTIKKTCCKRKPAKECQ